MRPARAKAADESALREYRVDDGHGESQRGGGLAAKQARRRLEKSRSGTKSVTYGHGVEVDHVLEVGHSESGARDAASWRMVDRSSLDLPLMQINWDKPEIDPQIPPTPEIDAVNNNYAGGGQWAGTHGPPRSVPARRVEEDNGTQ